jgi:hypothetical protein
VLGRRFHGQPAPAIEGRECRAHARHAALLEEILERHGAKLRRQPALMPQLAADAEDALQEACALSFAQAAAAG